MFSTADLISSRDLVEVSGPYAAPKEIKLIAGINNMIAGRYRGIEINSWLELPSLA
jgi:hypothetical protein